MEQIDQILELIKHYPKTITAASDETYNFFTNPGPQQNPKTEEKAETPPPKAVKKKPIDLNLTKTQEKKLDPSFDAFVKKSLPGIETTNAIPSDADAKKRAAAWKTKALITDCLVLASHPNEIPFLTNLARAIDTRLKPCRLLKTEQSDWESILASDALKLIIAPESTLFETKSLLSHMREHPKEGKRFLGHVPLLLLPELSLYQNDPMQKRHLWSLICQSL